MNEQTGTEPAATSAAIPGTRGGVKRRGLIAGAAALAAAGLAKLAGAGRAEASHDSTTPYTSDNTMHVDVVNTTLQTTTVLSSAAAGRVPALEGTNNNPATSPGGIGGIGVRGLNNSVSATANGIGVLGEVQAPTSVGVQGTNIGSPGIAVQGLNGSGIGPGAGVHGKSGSGTGVKGEATSGFGVVGASTNNIGVLGQAAGGSNASPGVFGSATNGYGVFGFSANSNGIAGQSGTSAAGCVGFAGAPGGYGIYGGIAVAGGYAGGFAGPVLVVGDFTVANGAKNAAVPHPDGSHRLLYCQESPEPWFEDFGEARLINGRAQVALDPDFIAVVHNDKYFVYLTPEADSNGLYVSNKSGAGFEVREQRSGTSSLAFSYRVVAKRKDIPGPRLGKIKLPQPIKELKRPPEPPRPAEPPAPPAESERSGR